MEKSIYLKYFHRKQNYLPQTIWNISYAFIIFGILTTTRTENRAQQCSDIRENYRSTNLLFYLAALLCFATKL